MDETQIKSKERVFSYGEVYTGEKEVKHMVDLVWNKFHGADSKIKATFFEPAAGNGNFLIEILNRKISEIKKIRSIRKRQHEFEINLFRAVSTIYGIDILMDNVIECRERLYSVCLNAYEHLYGKDVNSNFLMSIKYILDKNIICGDSLNGVKDGPKAEPIMISQWNIISQTKVKRYDYALVDLFTYGDIPSKKTERIEHHNIVNFKEVYTLG